MKDIIIISLIMGVVFGFTAFCLTGKLASGSVGIIFLIGAYLYYKYA